MRNRLARRSGFFIDFRSVVVVVAVVAVVVVVVVAAVVVAR